MPRKPNLPRINPAHSRGLVAAWPFYEKAYTTVRDLGPYGLNGTADVAATWVEQNRLGPAMDFNGTTQRVSIGTKAELNLTGTQLTIAGWIKRDVTATFGIILSRQGATIQYQFAWVSSADGTNPNKLRLILDHGAGNVTYAPGAAYTDTTTWHHIAVTYNGANVITYFDGALDGSTAATSSIASFSYGAFIGGNSAGTALTDGQIQDVRIYNRALSAQEIANLYSVGTRWQLYEQPRIPLLWIGTPPALRFENVEPANGDEYVTERLIEFDVITNNPGDDVREASIAVTVDGDSRTVTATAIANGYHVTAWSPFRPGATHTVLLSADTDATAGDPYEQSYSFTADLYGTMHVALLDGYGTDDTPTGALLDGFVPLTIDQLAVIDSVIPPQGVDNEVLALLDGAVVDPFDPLDATYANLMGRITLRFRQLFPAGIEIGEPSVGERLPAGIEVQGRGVRVDVLPAAIEIRDNAAIGTLPAAIEIVLPVKEVLPVGIEIGEQAKQLLPASLDIEGATTDGTLTLDNPSTLYTNEGNDA